nr:retrovirus-related Pol polyprotein from transposon TNT 1-94 [Tanacetum cinerariifolium]
MLYDGSVIAKETNVISITDSEETLMLEEESRSKMILKQSDPMITLDALIEGEWGFEHTKAVFLKEIIPFVKALKDIFNVFDKDLLNEKCLELKSELIKQHNMVEKDEYNRLLKRYSKLEQHCISLEIAMQLNKEIFQKNNISVNQTEPSFDQLFKLNNLKVKLQVKDTTIKKLKAHIKRVNETSTSESVKKDFDEIETINIELEHKVTKLIAENEHLKQTYKKLYDSIKRSRVRAKEQTKSLVNQVNQNMNVHAKSASKKNKKRKEWKPTDKVFNSVGYKWKPTRRTFTLVGNACPLTRITTTNKVPLRVSIPLEVVAPKHVVTRVYTRRPKVPKSVQSSKPKVAKSMTANRMEPDTSRGSDTSVDPSSSSYLIDCSGPNYSVVIQIVLWYLDSVCSKHMTGDRSQLTNFVYKFLGTVKLGNGQVAKIMRNGLVRGLPRLKFEKEHLCYACAMGKSKKQSHKPKSEDTNQEKLYLLHMDLCGPMCVASVNGKKYILVIVDDYSQFTWVKFLALKDEAPDFIIKFLKMIQVRLNATVGISHETSVARSPQQTGVVERSGLVPNPPPSAQFVQPSRHEWDFVFQPMFEFFSPPASVASPVLVEEARAPVKSLDLTSLTTVDQDAHSPSTSQTTYNNFFNKILI